MSAIGPEILLRIEPDCAWPLVVVLLRCGRIPMSVNDCFPRRVVKALASDILYDCLDMCAGVRYCDLARLEERAAR